MKQAFNTFHKKYDKSRTLQPFLYLMEYRVDSGLGEKVLFRGDGLPPCGIRGRNIWYFVSDAFVYFFKKIKYARREIKHKGTEDRILLSSTFLWSERYPDVLDGVLNRKDMIGMLAFSDCDIRRCLKHTELDQRRYRIMRAATGASVAGWRTKRLALKIFRYLSGRIQIKQKKDVDRLMRAFEKSISRDIERMAAVLKDRGIQQYITVNEYDLKEYIVIAACKKLGIRTKHLLHSFLMQLSLPEEKVIRRSYTDQLYFWSRSDLEWSRKYYEFVGIGQKIVYDVSGSPELCRRTFEQDIKKYKKKRAVTLLMPKMSESYSQNERRCLEEKRIQLIKKVYALAQREHMRMYVRYHPAEIPELMKEEKQVLDQYGISVARKGAEGLKQVLCQSMCIIGNNTSALILAEVYGANSFCVSMDGEVHDFGADMGIQDISINELEESAKIKGIGLRTHKKEPHYEYCLDEQKLFEM